MRSSRRFTSFSRTIAKVKGSDNILDDTPPQNTYLELDSHADTCCAGANCRIIEYTNRSCEVTAFSQHYDKLSNVPIVKAGTAYDAPNGETYILVLSCEDI